MLTVNLSSSEKSLGRSRRGYVDDASSLDSLSISSLILRSTEWNMGSVSNMATIVDTRNKVDNSNSTEVDVELDINTTNKGDGFAYYLQSFWATIGHLVM